MRKQMKHLGSELLEETTLYQGFSKLFAYHLRHRRFDGAWSPVLRREVMLRPAVAGVLAYDPAKEQVVMIEQFRAGAMGSQNPWLLEPIAGYIEPGETAEEMAHRESKEEAGLTLKALKLICDYWVSPGNSTAKVKLYCAYVEAKAVHSTFGLDCEAENIRVRIVSIKEIFEKLAKGDINNSMAIISLQWLKINHQKVRQQFLGG